LKIFIGHTSLSWSRERGGFPVRAFGFNFDDSFLDPCVPGVGRRREGRRGAPAYSWPDRPNGPGGGWLRLVSSADAAWGDTAINGPTTAGGWRGRDPVTGWSVNGFHPSVVQGEDNKISCLMVLDSPEIRLNNRWSRTRAAMRRSRSKSMNRLLIAQV